MSQLSQVGTYSLNDMDSYWKDEMLRTIEIIEVNLRKLEDKLPPEGFQEIDAVKFDVDMMKEMVKEIR